jgi:hypothetical protein
MSSVSPLRPESLPAWNARAHRRPPSPRKFHLVEYFVGAAIFGLLAGLEWLAYLNDWPRRPVVYSIVAVVALGIAVWRVSNFRRQAERFRRGPDRAQGVAQFLEPLRKQGAHLFHGVASAGLNLDHIVVSRHGIYVIDVQDGAKPWPKTTIRLDHNHVLVADTVPDRNLAKNVQDQAQWLARMLEQATGKRFVVRGLVIMPQWWTKQKDTSMIGVLEPKSLCQSIERAEECIAPGDLWLVSEQLSQCLLTSGERCW